MKVTGKLLLAFLSTTLVVLAASAFLRVERERALFEADMRKDDAAQAIALADGVELLVARGETDAARALVRRADEHATHLRARWVGLQDAVPPAERPLLAPREIGLLREDAPVHRRISGGPEGPALLTYRLVGAEAPGRGRTAIEIREPLAEERAFIRGSIVRSIASAGMLFAATGVMTAIAGGALLGRPLRSLRGKARRAASGDLSGPLRLGRRDELGELADELNGMCDRLAESRRTVDEAHAARIAALEQVRRADRLATVGQLAAGIAHEIGTPLGVVAGRARMIATGEEQGAEARESARVVEEQAKRIAAIVRQLLDFSRKRRPEKADVELSSLARGVIGLLEQMARKRGVTLILHETAPAAVS
jgi:signal transduction histidine kinase